MYVRADASVRPVDPDFLSAIQARAYIAYLFLLRESVTFRT